MFENLHHMLVCTYTYIVIKAREILTGLGRNDQRWAPKFFFVVHSTLFHYFFCSPKNAILLVFQIGQFPYRYPATAITVWKKLQSKKCIFTASKDKTLKFYLI